MSVYFMMTRKRTIAKKIVSIFIICSFVISSLICSGKNVSASANITVTFGQTEARQMLSRVNEFRTGSMAWAWNESNTEKVYYPGLGTLAYDYELEKVAMLRAAEIAVSYSHTRPNGESCFTAYPSAYDKNTKGENIAYGSPKLSEEKVFLLWREDNEMYSGQGHRRNMLEKDFTSIGIGHVNYNGCDYWVQEFSDTVVNPNDPGANDSQATVTIDGVSDIPKGSNNSGNNSTNNNGNGTGNNQTPSKTTNDNGSVSGNNTAKQVRFLSVNVFKSLTAVKINGKISVKGAKVKIKLGKKAYKKAKVKKKKYTFNINYKIKKKTKVVLVVSKKNYKGEKLTYYISPLK